MGIWKTALSTKENDCKYQNNFDEAYRFIEGHYSFDINKSLFEVFEKIVNLSLATMRNKPLLENLKSELVLFDNKNGQKYLVAEYELNKIYSLRTTLDQDIHWTIFEFRSLTDKKTRVTYKQKLKKEKTLGGAIRFLGKRNFIKNIRLKGRQIQLFLMQK